MAADGILSVVTNSSFRPPRTIGPRGSGAEAPGVHPGAAVAISQGEPRGLPLRSGSGPGMAPAEMPAAGGRGRRLLRRFDLGGAGSFMLRLQPLTRGIRRGCATSFVELHVNWS